MGSQQALSILKNTPRGPQKRTSMYMEVLPPLKHIYIIDHIRNSSSGPNQKQVGSAPGIPHEIKTNTCPSRTPEPTPGPRPVAVAAPLGAWPFVVPPRPPPSPLAVCGHRTLAGAHCARPCTPDRGIAVKHDGPMCSWKQTSIWYLCN